MKISVIYPDIPPSNDAIGQYTAMFCQRLAERGVVISLHTREGQSVLPVAGVDLQPHWPTGSKAQGSYLEQHIQQSRPDWLLLQYNPFSYGRWGVNLDLPEALISIRRRFPETKLAVMFHETFMPIFFSWKSPPMAVAQRIQFRQLVGVADQCFVSVEAWADQFQARFPQKSFLHCPVASNMPRVPIDRVSARERLGISPDVTVVGLFGNAHVSRMLPFACDSIERVRASGLDARLLYIGPDSSLVRSLIRHEPIAAEGPLENEEVSRRFAAMDIYLAPFIDGASTRRTSLMTGLQHGIPTVSTFAANTERVLREADKTALLLLPVDSPEVFVDALQTLIKDGEFREQLALGSAALYRHHFDWSVMIDRFLESFRRGVSS